MIVKVLGMDPSLQNFGLVRANIDVVTMKVQVERLRLEETKPDKKAKTVRKNSQDLERARQLQAAMIEEAQGCSVAFVEVPVGSQSARAMASYGMCLGVLSSCPIPLVQLTPNEVKLAGAGNKNATKSEMIEWAVKAHPEGKWLTQKRKGQQELIAKNEHLADATAAIHAGLSTDDFRSVVAILKMTQGQAA